MRKIYVTGLGVISGIGKGVEENLDSLKAGKHGMGKITLFPTALDVPVSEVKQSNEELKKLLSLPSGMTYSRTALLGLWAAQGAARDAELDFTSPRIGLISSTSIGGMDASERFYASFREDNRVKEYRRGDTGSGELWSIERCRFLNGYLQSVPVGVGVSDHRRR